MKKFGVESQSAASKRYDRLLRYHPRFIEDVTEAADWYDAKSSGLGDTFIEFVGSGIERISAAPLRFPLGHSGCRFLRLAARKKSGF